jgi:hypothetical protein
VPVAARALGLDRKRFSEIEEKLKAITDNKQLTPEDRAQSKALTKQKAAMDRQTGNQQGSCRFAGLGQRVGVEEARY